MLNVTPDALAQTYTNHRPELVQYARDRLRELGLDQQLAEDVIQDVAVHWYSKERRLRSEQAALSYVRRAISNHCLNLFRDDPWARNEFEWLDEETA